LAPYDFGQLGVEISFVWRGKPQLFQPGLSLVGKLVQSILAQGFA